MKAVLITGADGYLGCRLVRSLLEGSQSPVIAWVRSSSPEELAKKRESMASRLGPLIDHERLSIATGDLRDADPFRAVDPSTVGRIVHSASVTMPSPPSATTLLRSRLLACNARAVLLHG